MQEFYFTFGSSNGFPYQGGYLIVVAHTKEEAFEKFRRKYPDRHEDTLNCAFYYTRKEWESLSTHDMGECHEVIS